MGDQYRSFPNLLGYLEFTHFTAGFGGNFYILTVRKSHSFDIRRI